MFEHTATEYDRTTPLMTAEYTLHFRGGELYSTSLIPRNGYYRVAGYYHGYYESQFSPSFIISPAQHINELVTARRP